MNKSGYSKTPLAKKLGIKTGFNLMVLNPPLTYLELFDELPDDLNFSNDTAFKKDFIHYFSDNLSQLEEKIELLKNSIVQDGMIWISWPKKASKIPTDLNGNIVREIGLKNGLVDIKVCAINEIWSGLKFVIPVKNRI